MESLEVDDEMLKKFIFSFFPIFCSYGLLNLNCSDKWVRRRGIKSEFIEARKTIDVCGVKLVLWEESCKSVTKL